MGVAGEWLVGSTRPGDRPGRGFVSLDEASPSSANSVRSGDPGPDQALGPGRPSASRLQEGEIASVTLSLHGARSGFSSRVAVKC